jgi:site-specific recombinase XerD
LVRNPRGSAAQSKPNPYSRIEVARLRALLSQRFPTLPIAGPGRRALTRFARGDTNALRSHLWRHCVRVQLEAQIALALELGLRRVELYSLTIAALHHDNEDVVVLTAKQAPGANVKRSIPYTGHARSCIQEWLDLRDLLATGHDEPWLYLRYYGTRSAQLQPMPFWKLKDSLRKQLGEEWRWHRLRHTAATEWLRAGLSLDKVSAMMGHSSLDQTREYTQVLNSDIRESMADVADAFAKQLGVPA